MKRLLAMAVTIILAATAFSQDFQPYNMGDSVDIFFRDMNRDDPPYGYMGSPKLLFIGGYEGQEYFSFNGVECRASWFFLDRKLVGARYFTTKEHSNLDEYLEEYKKISEYLAGKYETVEVREFWFDETHKGDPQKLALAVSLGHYNISTTYCYGDTEIVHVMKEYSSSLRPIYQIIDYSTKKLLDFEATQPPEKKDILRKKKQ